MLSHLALFAFAFGGDLVDYKLNHSGHCDVGNVNADQNGAVYFGGLEMVGDKVDQCCRQTEGDGREEQGGHLGVLDLRG